MLTGTPANFDNDDLDEMFTDWLWSLKEFSVTGIVVLAPAIFSDKNTRHAIAVYPPRLLDAAKQLADSTDFFDAWSASRSPLVVWQTLSSSDQSNATSWRKLWRSFGCESFVRVAFEVPDQRSFECYLFSSASWQSRQEPSMVAWSTLSIWPELKQKLSAVISPLSPRELQCLRMAFAGLTARDTADQIGCSERTVNFHITNAMGKLQVDSKVAAIQRAISLGCL